MTYARARLWLGISNVGFWVLISTMGLLFHWEAFFYNQTTGELIINCLALYLLFSFPFDIMGGYILPHRFNKQKESFKHWFLDWFKGALSQATILGMSSYGLLMVFSFISLNPVRIALIVALQILFATLQPAIAQWVGNFKVNSKHDSEDIWESRDIGFTGGITATGRSIFPQNWQSQFSQDELNIIRSRRRVLKKHPMNIFGVINAITYNTTGAVIAFYSFQLSFNQASDWLTFMWVMTLWSFIGVLVLPSISQAAALTLDQLSKQFIDTSQSPAEHVLLKLDSLQDGEPSRHPWIQRIFHPTPSAHQRLQEMQANSPLNPFPSWHIARRALYLSWPFMNLLNRAVHCNIGRPDLWVMLPCEG